MQNDEKSIAVFIDFENVAMGVRESKYGNFDIDLVLKRLVEKGKILVKRAYSDWHRYADFKRAFHQAAIELIDVPQTRYSGKNSADIRMVVDAMDMAYQKEHIDTFVIVSGDSDFSPLVSKLRENGRFVIGIGVKQSSSDLLINNCDEFIFYEDLVRPAAAISVVDPQLHQLSPKKTEAIRLVMESFQALQREGKEVIYGSMIKQTLIRKLPSFNETYFGYPTFSRLLEDAAENKLLKLTKDQRSGGYLVTLPIDVANREAAMTSAAAENGQPAEAGADVSAGSTPPVPVQRQNRDLHRRSRWDRGKRVPYRQPGVLRSSVSAVPVSAEVSPEIPALPSGDTTASPEAPVLSEGVNDLRLPSETAGDGMPVSTQSETSDSPALPHQESGESHPAIADPKPKPAPTRGSRPRYRRGPAKPKPATPATPSAAVPESSSGEVASAESKDTQKALPKPGSTTRRRPPSRTRNTRNKS